MFLLLWGNSNLDVLINFVLIKKKSVLPTPWRDHIMCVRSQFVSFFFKFISLLKFLEYILSLWTDSYFFLTNIWHNPLIVIINTSIILQVFLHLSCELLSLFITTIAIIILHPNQVGAVRNILIIKKWRRRKTPAGGNEKARIAITTIDTLCIIGFCQAQLNLQLQLQLELSIALISSNTPTHPPDRKSSDLQLPLQLQLQLQLRFS